MQDNFNEKPLLVSDSGTLAINENSPAYSLVSGGPISALDGDDNILVFTVIGGSGLDTFSIATVQSTKNFAGYFSTEILLKEGVQLNFELNSIALKIEILCEDESGLVSASQMYSVSILDINDKPVIDELLSTVIPENSGGGTVLGTIVYSDEDAGQTVTFLLDGHGLSAGNIGYSCWSVNAEIMEIMRQIFLFFSHNLEILNLYSSYR